MNLSKQPRLVEVAKTCRLFLAHDGAYPVALVSAKLNQVITTLNKEQALGNTAETALVVQAAWDLIDTICHWQSRMKGSTVEAYQQSLQLAPNQPSSLPFGFALEDQAHATPCLTPWGQAVGRMMVEVRTGRRWPVGDCTVELPDGRLAHGEFSPRGMFSGLVVQYPLDKPLVVQNHPLDQLVASRQKPSRSGPRAEFVHWPKHQFRGWVYREATGPREGGHCFSLITIGETHFCRGRAAEEAAWFWCPKSGPPLQVTLGAQRLSDVLSRFAAISSAQEAPSRAVRSPQALVRLLRTQLAASRASATPAMDRVELIGHAVVFLAEQGQVWVYDNGALSSLPKLSAYLKALQNLPEVHCLPVDFRSQLDFITEDGCSHSLALNSPGLSWQDCSTDLLTKLQALAQSVAPGTSVHQALMRLCCTTPFENEVALTPDGVMPQAPSWRCPAE